jgi:hypothetical protein
MPPIIEPDEKCDTINILIVDDEREAHQDIQSAVGEMDGLKLYAFETPDQLRTIAGDVRIDICIADIRFKEELKFTELRTEVSSYWPGASIIVLSNFEKDLSDDERRAVKTISKARFKITPSLLCKEIIRELSGIDTDDPLVKLAVIEHLESRSPIGEEQEIELLKLIGYVVEMHDSYVEVAVEEPERKQHVLQFLIEPETYAQWMGLSQGGQLKRLRMKSDKFIAAGIGQDMKFIYRIFTKGSSTTSEITPYEEDDPFNVEDFDEDPMIKRLEEIETLAMQALKHSNKRNKGSK